MAIYRKQQVESATQLSEFINRTRQAKIAAVNIFFAKKHRK